MENVDLSTTLHRAGRYDANGFFLRRDVYIDKLPLFAAGRYPSEGRFWIRGVVSRSADGGGAYTDDKDFLRRCLIYTCLAYHNKCLSFTGSDKRVYRNELCLDDGTVASTDLAEMTLDDHDEKVLAAWQAVLEIARETENYDPSRTYGTYQIDKELNTFEMVDLGKKSLTKVYDYPLLHSAIQTLKTLTVEYLESVIADDLWKYELLK